jgi:hypothetical protein
MFLAPFIISLPYVGAVIPEVALFSTAPASCLFRVSLPGVGGDRLPPLCLGDIFFWGLAATSTACRSASVIVFSPPSSSWILMSGFYTPYSKAISASLPMWSSCSMGYARWASSSMAVANTCRVLRLSVFMLLIDSGKQRQSVGLRTGPLVPEWYPRKTYLSECRVARLQPGPSGLCLSTSIF